MVSIKISRELDDYTKTTRQLAIITLVRELDMTSNGTSVYILSTKYLLVQTRHETDTYVVALITSGSYRAVAFIGTFEAI